MHDSGCKAVQAWLPACAELNAQLAAVAEEAGSLARRRAALAEGRAAAEEHIRKLSSEAAVLTVTTTQASGPTAPRIRRNGPVAFFPLTAALLSAMRLASRAGRPHVGHGACAADACQQAVQAAEGDEGAAKAVEAERDALLVAVKTMVSRADSGTNVAGTERISYSANRGAGRELLALARRGARAELRPRPAGAALPWPMCHLGRA